VCGESRTHSFEGAWAQQCALATRHNILEGAFTVILVNAKHIKHVTGRKTDVKDAQWIAELLQHGLLKASFIPELAQRELRELVRYHTQLLQERSREVNRVQKVLEDANLKLGSVASDVLGVSGRAMLEAIIAGQDDPAVLADLAKARLRTKIAELERALDGHVRASHRLLRLHLEHIDDWDAKLACLDEEIERRLPPFDQDDLGGTPGRHSRRWPPGGAGHYRRSGRRHEPVRQR
jgi:transposase